MVVSKRETMNYVDYQLLMIEDALSRKHDIPKMGITRLLFHPLFMAEGHHRVDAHGPPRGNIGRQQSY